MNALLTTIFIQPILNLLIWLYNVIPGHDIGFAIIALTIIIKILLYPLTHIQIKQQRSLQEIQPKIDEIRTRLKDDKEAQAKELMEMYKKEKVNPAASCLPILVQLPVFFALYRALAFGLEGNHFNLLYTFISVPTSIAPMWLGLINLTKPSYILAAAAALIQFLQTKQILRPPAATLASPPPEVAKSEGAKDESMATMMNKQMTYVMPVMTLIIGFSLPGGLALYWFTMSLLTYLQQSLVMRKQPPRLAPQLQQDRPLAD